MVRVLTLERQTKVLEARNLRQAGFAWPEIAKRIDVPFKTLEKWIPNMGCPKRGKMGLTVKKPQIGTQATPQLDITLYPMPYEKTEGVIPPGTVDLVLTDPPYLVANSDITRTNQAALRRDYGKWDKTPEAQYHKSVAKWSELMAAQLKDGGSLYLFIGWKQSPVWQNALESAGLTFGGPILWHRKNPAPQIRQTRWCPAFDLILYFTKGVANTFNWQGQNEMHNVITGPICAGLEREDHPTQKPRWLLWKLLWVSSNYGDTILDPFAGSGSTAFASQSGSAMQGRKFLLVECEPKYIGGIQSTAKEEFGCPVTVATP